MVLSPTIEEMSRVMKNNLQKVAGSPKKRMPTMTVPTAPMPVQTGYAVPMGSVCVALASRAMLSMLKHIKPPIHAHHSMPSVSLALPRQKVKATSQSPAAIRINQFIINIRTACFEGCGNRLATPSSGAAKLRFF